MDNAAIVDSYNEGTSLKELARLSGFPVQRVRDVLTIKGIEIRSRGRAREIGYKLSEDDRTSIIARYKKGATAFALAEKHGVSKERICQICREAGVIRRPGRR